LENIILTPRALERRLKRHLLKEPQNFFAIITPGFEHLLKKEIAGMGIPVTREICGGVEFSGPIDLIYSANLRLRTANRILMRIASFTCRSYPELYNKSKRISWELYTGFNREISFSVSSTNSRLHHSQHICDAVFGAIKDQMEKLGLEIQSRKESPLKFFIRFADDECTISIDTSGELLYKRSYRLQSGCAPIRETTAAALLMEAEWQRYNVVADPLCGSATFMLEAALMSHNRAPGINRQFAFYTWPSFNECKWERYKSQARMEETNGCQTVLIASDISSGAVEAAQENLSRLELDGAVRLSKQDCLCFECTLDKGLIISNLPYGKRVGASIELKEFYRKFGAHLRKKFNGWSFGFVVADKDFEKTAGLKIRKETGFVNGGIRVRFVMGKIV